MLPHLFHEPNLLLVEYSATLGHLVEHRATPSGNLSLTRRNAFHRGYGKEAILRCLMEASIGSTFVLPEHILRVHPFVGMSFLDPPRYGEDDDDVVATEQVGNQTVEAAPRPGGSEGLPTLATMIDRAD